MTISTYAANKVLDFFLRGVSIGSAPTHVHVSLHTADPGSTGASECVVGTWPAYVRKQADGGGAIATGFTAAAAKATENALELLWPGYDGSGTITVTHFGIWDAASSGNFLFGGALTASKTLSPTDESVCKVGDLDVVAT